MKIEDIHLTHATINELKIDTEGSMLLLVEDYKEDDWILTFDDILGFESIGFRLHDLGFLAQENKDPFRIKCCESVDEDEKEFKCFHIYNNDEDYVVFKVVCRDYTFHQVKNKETKTTEDVKSGSFFNNLYTRLFRR